MPRLAETHSPSTGTRRGTRRSRALNLLVRALPLALLATTIASSSVSAAEVVAPFNSVTLVANPRPWPISGLPNTIDGSVAGLVYARIFTGQAAATGVVIDYGFTTPEFQVTAVQLFNNGGGNLSDFDGIGTALVEVFDPAGTVLFSGSLNAGNGSAGFRTNFPAPLDNVARVRLSNITNLPGAAAPDIIWREFRAFQNVATPNITTALAADGYSDNVTITGTEGLDGTLTWTLFGPVSAGPSGTCTTATWTGAPVFDTGTVPITGDGVVLTTPSTPTADGCYSYGDVLSSPYYTAAAVSPVGQAAETFAWPVTPTVTTAISADGYSDDVTIRGTNGFGGTLTWSLLGPVDAGPGGTCSDAGYAGAPTAAAGTMGVVGDVTVTITPPADPTAPGCYTYEVTLSGPNIQEPVTSLRGEPAEIFARASTPSIDTAINPDGFSDDLIVTGTSGFAGTATWTLYGPAAEAPSGACTDADFAAAPVFATGTAPIPGDGTSTVTPSTPPIETGCYSYGVVLSGPNYAADAESAVGLPTETFFQPLAPATTTTSTTTTTSLVPVTDPCASTTSSTTSTSSTTTTTSSTTTTIEPPPESLSPNVSAEGSSTTEPQARSSSQTTTGSTSTTSTTAPAAPWTSSAAPIGFRRAPRQVPDPCAPPTTVAPETTVAPPTPAVPSGGGAVGGGGSNTGALPVTGQRPAGPIALIAILIVVAGAALVVTGRPRQ